ncbi:cytidylate kinase family protein [Polaromonas sp.]|uniref:cytidylate kinase family protein n=1 Tax=Polaromonas sp. TaxID=1869339 RepID=UPI001809AC2D|nr:cytidylate kinase family protein [Polaromonas sp.]NMM07217.1 BON domain-containing protein [Polaromonas sp.]
MPVVAITHEMGSLAKDVALQLAQSSSLAVMRHEVLEHVAGKMHVPSSLISRLREGKAGLVERFTTDHERVAVYTAQELFTLAEKGNVVLRGWGATCLLRPVQHVVTVRVTGPFKKRVEWLMGNLETDDVAFAEAEVRRSDDAHATKMHDQFGVTWGDPLLYDLVLNTDRISVESCVAQIQQLAGRPEFQETAESRAMLADLALNARIRAALKDHDATRNIKIHIESRSGRVMLRGIVLNVQESAEVAGIVSTVAGVSSVDNQLGLMARSRLYASTTGI